MMARARSAATAQELAELLVLYGKTVQALAELRGMLQETIDEAEKHLATMFSIAGIFDEPLPTPPRRR
jgi:hypothetical protein